MFEAKIEKAAVLKKLIDAIRELCKEINLDCGADGIQLQAMDSSHVALVAMHLKEPAFTSYRADKPVSLGINMENLAKVFKVCGNDDTVNLKHEDGADTLEITFEGAHDRVAQFELKLLELDAEHLGIPEGMKYNAFIELPSKEFASLIHDLKDFGDTVMLNCSKDHMKFSVTGDIGAGNIIVRPRDTEKNGKVAISCEDPLEASFALRYLNFFTKATPLGNTVTVSFSPDVPLVVDYPIQNADAGYLKFFLAPKVDE